MMKQLGILFGAIPGILAALPELIRLYLELRAQLEEGETQSKVKADVKTIHEAFAAKDADKLNALFRTK